jgi:hypothetical protein
MENETKPAEFSVPKSQTAKPSNNTSKKPRRQEENTKNVRRVGTVTLGFAFIAVGIILGGYYFVPNFNWRFALKLLPLLLVMLGVEVLVAAARPERFKYDIFSIFLCILLCGGSLCISLGVIYCEHEDCIEKTARQIEIVILETEDESGTSLYISGT